MDNLPEKENTTLYLQKNLIQKMKMKIKISSNRSNIWVLLKPKFLSCKCPYKVTQKGRKSSTTIWQIHPTGFIIQTRISGLDWLKSTINMKSFFHKNIIKKKLKNDQIMFVLDLLWKKIVEKPNKESTLNEIFTILFF